MKKIHVHKDAVEKFRRIEKVYLEWACIGEKENAERKKKLKIRYITWGMRIGMGMSGIYVTDL